MSELPKEAMAAISYIEHSSRHMSKITAIRDWPGLSGAQRAAAMSLACLDYLKGGDVRPAEIAAFLGVSVERGERLFDGVEHPPYELTQIGTDAAAYAPSQALEYGE